MRLFEEIFVCSENSNLRNYSPPSGEFKIPSQKICSLMGNRFSASNGIYY